MKSRYMIGFFAAFTILVAALSAGYQMTYDRVVERRTSGENEAPDAGSVAAEGQNVNNEGTDTEDGFYLCELQGFVTVYLSDRKTIFELTEIPLTDLPEEVQQEVASGKYIATAEELYAFLENYSS